MSRLRTVADYERELAQLDAMIANEVRLLAIEPDFGAEVGLRSLQHRRRSLADEMARLGDEGMSGYELDVILNGAPVRGHAVSAAFMGRLLVRIQDFVGSTLASSFGRGEVKGRLPGNVMRAAELQFASSFDGSFGMRLETAHEELNLEGEVPLAGTFEKFIALVDAGDGPDVVDQLAKLGSKRAVEDYESVIEELAKCDASMTVVWPNLRGQRTASLNTTQANRLLATLREVEEREHSQWYVGKLDISNARHGRFGFTTDEGQQFEGVVEKDIENEMQRYHQLERCKAWIQTLTVRHRRTNTEKATYRLQELAPAEE